MKASTPALSPNSIYVFPLSEDILPLELTVNIPASALSLILILLVPAASPKVTKKSPPSKYPEYNVAPAELEETVPFTPIRVLSLAALIVIWAFPKTPTLSAPSVESTAT